MTDDLSELPKIDVPSSTVEQLNKLTKSRLVERKGNRQKLQHPQSELVTAKVEHEQIPVTESVPVDSFKKDGASDSASPTIPSPPVLPPGLPPGQPSSTQVPTSLASSIKEPSKAADTYNGSNAGNYAWSQTMTDVDIRVPVSCGTTGKDLKIEIKNDSLLVEALKPEKKVFIYLILFNVVMYMYM